MLTKSVPGLAFDTICFVEGSFKIALFSEEPSELIIRAVYANRDSLETFGGANFPSETWSVSTRELFQRFIKSAETDASSLLFSERIPEVEGVPRPPHPWEQAETGAPIDPKPRGLGGM